MASSPFRRRKAAKAVRNLAIAEAALALAKDRLAPVTGGHSRRPSGKLLLLGGAVAAVGAAALLKRDKVAGLLPSRSGDPEPPTPAYVPPQPSNYDAPGPVANTSTPVPAPDPVAGPEPIDEQAEEDAAAAEAAAIGGSSSDYAGDELGEPADAAHRPLAEAGEGESEGQEQAEAELADNASFRDDAPSDAERQIDETIEQADQPTQGETPEPLASEAAEPAAEEPPPAQGSFLPPTAAAGQPPVDEAPAPDEEPPPAEAAEPAPSSGASDDTLADTPGGGISGRPYAGLDQVPSDDAPAAPPTEDATPDKAAPDDVQDAAKSEGDDSGGDDWRTWSGRSVNP